MNNPFKFADGYLDASGYYLFGVRYYDPSLGRWTQQDPVGGGLEDLNSRNRHIYVEDDLINKVVTQMNAVLYFALFALVIVIIVAILNQILYKQQIITRSEARFRQIFVLFACASAVLFAFIVALLRISILFVFLSFFLVIIVAGVIAYFVFRRR